MDCHFCGLIAVASNEETVGVVRPCSPTDVESIMHTLGRFGMKKFAGAVMWVIAKVFAYDNDTANAYDNDNHCLNDWQSFDKLCNQSLTKTIKNPDGSVSAAVSENSSDGSTGSPQRLDLSATATSTGSNTASYKPSGKKQESFTSTGLSTGSLRNQNHSLVVSDWQERWPWMICEPNEKEGKLFAHCSLFIGAHASKLGACSTKS